MVWLAHGAGADVRSWRRALVSTARRTARPGPCLREPRQFVDWRSYARGRGRRRRSAAGMRVEEPSRGIDVCSARLPRRPGASAVRVAAACVGLSAPPRQCRSAPASRVAAAASSSWRVEVGVRRVDDIEDASVRTAPSTGQKPDGIAISNDQRPCHAVVVKTRTAGRTARCADRESRSPPDSSRSWSENSSRRSNSSD